MGSISRYLRPGQSETIFDGVFSYPLSVEFFRTLGEMFFDSFDISLCAVVIGGNESGGI